MSTPFITLSEASMAVISVLASVTAGALFYSPFFVILKLEKSRQPNNVLFMPYALMLLNCTNFTIYGSLLTDYVLFVVNALGVFPSIYFTNVLMHNTDKKSQIWMKVVYQLLAVYAFVNASMASFLDGFKTRADVVGIMCAVALVATLLMPLNNVYQAFRTRRCDPVPILPAVSMLVNSTFWMLYGLGKGDLYIVVPNVVGMFVGLFQTITFAIFFFFGSKSAPKAEPDSVENGNTPQGDHREESKGFEDQNLVARRASDASGIEYHIADQHNDNLISSHVTDIQLQVR